MAGVVGTVGYNNLPLAESKLAPPTYYGDYWSLNDFLSRYIKVCGQHLVTDDGEKCRGILQYCDISVADVIENLDAFEAQDFDELIKEFQRLYDGNRKQTEYHTGHIVEFTREWRKYETSSLEMLIEYEREYIALAAPIKKAGHIGKPEYDRYFWEGLGPETRIMLERQMSHQDPGLQRGSPFPVAKIMEAAEQVFDRNQFDRHLREEEMGATPKLRERKTRSYRHKKSGRRRDDSDTDSDSDSDGETPRREKRSRSRQRDKPRRSLFEKVKVPVFEISRGAVHERPRVAVHERPRSPSHERTRTPTTEKPPALPSALKKSGTGYTRDEIDEISSLTEAMQKLHISQPEYRSLYTRLYLLSSAACKFWDEPPASVQKGRSYLNQEPLQPARRDQPPQPMRRDFPPPLMRRDPPPPPVQRGMPPHQMAPPPDRPYEGRRELTCFGCREKGHAIGYCPKIDVYCREGHIQRNNGRLQWADGSNIFREPEEPWTNAIDRRLQAMNVTRTTDEGKQPIRGGGVYFVEVSRKESDADTDDQEDLGWSSGTAPVHHLQSYGVERTPRVNRETRQKVAPHVPARPHRVKEFPARGHLNFMRRKEDVVPKHAHFDESQERLQRPPSKATPIDTSQAKFHGEADSELVPMDVEQSVVGEEIDHRGKALTRNPNGPVRNVTQTRAKGKAQLEVINKLMGTPLTLSLHQIACIAPNVRRDLVGTLKAIRDDVAEEPGKDSPEEPKKVALGQGDRRESTMLTTKELGRLEDDHQALMQKLADPR